MQYRNIDKQALKENGYTVLSKITIVGTNTVFTEDDHIVNWIYEDYRYVPNNGFIGQFVERILDGNLQDISEDVVLEDTEINLQLGIVNGLDNDTTTWYDYGNFLITKVEKTDTTGNYKFESADYTKKFNKVFDGDYTDTTYTKSFNQKIEDEETVTALWLAQYVCAQAGVILNDTNFTNYSFVISSNQYDSEDTLRKIMQDIGKLAYSWVRVGEDNKVHIDFTPKATSSVDQYDRLTTDEYYVSKKSDLTFGPVNKVLIGMSNVEGENLYVTSPDYTEETECAIKIYDNNLTNTEELRQIALNGASRLFGLTYTPVEINSVGHPWLDGDELIKLTNVDDVELYTYPFNRKISYSGYIESTIGAEAQTAQESKYEYKSDIISDVKKTSIIVDKQEQTITGLVENMKDIILETTIKKTEEGNPIEIYDAGSYPVEDFKIYGNAIQDGTPSVANPVEIQTLTSKEENENHSGVNIEFYNDTDNYSIENNYVLDGNTTQYTTTGIQLFNKSISPHNIAGATLTQLETGIRATFSGGSATTYRYGSIEIPNSDSLLGQKVVLKATMTPKSSNNGTIAICHLNSGGAIVGSTITRLNTTGSISVTMPSSYNTNATQFGLLFYANVTGTLVENDYVDYTNVMLVKGTQAPTTYEPYTGGIASPNPNYPQPINVVTGLQEVEVKGKNLLNNKNLNYDYTNTASSNNILETIDTGIKYTTTLTSGTPFVLFKVVNLTPYKGKTIRIKGNHSNGGRIRYGLTNSDASTRNLIGNVSSGTTIYQVPNDLGNTPYLYYDLSILSPSQINSVNYTDMVITIDNEDMTYEPYKGKSYEINLGKQLFNFDDTHYFRFPGASTLSKTNNVITFANSLDNNHGYVWWNIPVQIGKQISISYSNMVEETIQSASGVYYIFSDTPIVAYGNDISTNSTQINKTNKYATITATKQYMTLILRVRMVGNISVSDLIVNYGTPTTYAEYFTPIELNKISTYKDYIFKGKGVNLFDVSTITNTFINYSTGASASNDAWRSTPYEDNLKPNTEYTLSWVSNSGYFQANITYYDSTQTYISGVDFSANNTYQKTFTTPSEFAYYRIAYAVRVSGTDYPRNNIQLQEGTSVSLYEPYNSKDKWLLHKEIGKVLFTGSSSESWTQFNNSSYSNTITRYRIDVPNVNKDSDYIVRVMSNYFVGGTLNVRNIESVTTQFDGSKINIFINISTASDVTAFKTWLSTHNTLVYYVLANPTTTEITNNELIEDLESLELVDGTNNIAITSSDLPGILNINQTKYPYQIIRIKDNTGMYNDYKLLLKDVEYARINDNRDYIYPENNKWYSYKIINKINSYNGETIDTDYISTTGELSTGATVYYVANEPNIQEIVDENILAPLNGLKNTLLYNGYNKIELLNELVDKLSITYLTDSELNASYATKSELQITANNITTTVSETTTKVNELDEKIEEVNASISEQTSTSITDWFNTSLKSLIEDLETSTNNNSNEIINIQSYIRRGRITDETSPYYNQAYIELGDSTNQTTLRILQNRIQFLTNGEETAYISNNQLYINESTILTKEKIGHWVTTEDEDGLLNTYWEA